MPPHGPNRYRESRLVTWPGAALAASAFTCCGGAALAALPPQIDFVETQSVGGTLKDNTPQVIQKVGAALDPLRAVLTPASIGMFAGKMDYSKLSFLDRTIAKAVGSVEGDWRNWDAIRAWASQALPPV